MTGANFVTACREERLDKEGTKEKTNTDEEMESIDEGSAPLRPKCEYQQNAVRCYEYSITEELMEE